MNKIYKIKWCHATQCFVAVSELAKSQGKSSKVISKVLRPSLPLFKLAKISLALFMAMGLVAQANAVENAQKDSALVSNNTQTQEKALVTLKSEENKDENKLEEIEKLKEMVSFTPSSITNNYANNSATAQPRGAGDLYFHVNDNSGTQGAGNATTNAGTATDKAGATGKSAVTAGLGAQATQQDSIAIGRGAQATTGFYATAIGVLTKAAQSGVAIGQEAHALGAETIAIGTRVSAEKTHALGIGSDIEIKGQNSIMIGNNSAKKGIGKGTNGRNAVAIGAGGGTSELPDGTIVDNLVSQANGDFSIVMGTSAESTQAAINGISIGKQSKVEALGGTTLGSESITTVNDGVALGSWSTADRANTDKGDVYIPLGAGKKQAQAVNRTAVEKNMLGAISVGGTFEKTDPDTGDITKGIRTRQITYVAAGSKDYDAVNVAQLKAVGQLVDEHLVKPILLGSGNDLTETDPQTLGQKDPVKFNITGQNGLEATAQADGIIVKIDDITKAKIDEIDNKLDANSLNNITSNDGSITITQGDITAGDVDISIAKTDITTQPNGTVDTPANPDSVVTAGSVANAINNAGWNVQGNGNTEDLVNAGNNVNFVDGAGTTAVVESDGTTTNIKYDVKLNQDTMKLDPQGNITVNTTPLVSNPDNGTVDTPANTNSIATAGDVANAINNAGIRVTTTNGTGTKDQLIKTGEVIEFDQGDNIVVTQANNKFTVATAKEVTFDKVTSGEVIADKVIAGPVVIDQNGIDMQNNSVINIKPTLPQTANPGTTSQTAPTVAPDQMNNAATVGDILNAGWNVQGNGAEKDFVKAYDTINFVDGAGTTAVVESDGTTTNIKYDVKLNQDTMKLDPAGNITVNTTPLVSNPDNGLVDTPANTNSIATAGDVANAINNAGFIATSSANGGVNTGSKDHLVKTGEKLEFVAGKDMTITQEDGKFTFETNNQTLVNNTQLPVVYTKADGTKVYPQADGTFNTAPDGSGDKVDLGDVISSMQGPDGSTTTPQTLTNVASNLPGTKDNAPVTVTGQEKPQLTEAQKQNAASVDDVLNAGWNVQGNGTDVDFVQAYDKVNFADGAGTTAVVESDGTTTNIKYDVKLNQDTMKLDPQGNITVNTTPLVSNPDNGTVDTPANPNSIATAGDVANAINNAGFIATSSANGGVNTGSKDHLVKTGEKLEFVAGKDMTITQEDGKFTFETNNQTLVNNTQLPVVYTKADGTKVYPQADGTFNTAPDGSGDKVDLGDVISSMQGPDGSTTTPTTLTNVASNLPGTKGNAPVVATGQEKPTLTDAQKQNAASVDDVLNAGWNVQGNGTDVDFVQAYDKVNFADGAGTTAVVESDGTTTNIKYDVKLNQDTMKLDPAGNITVNTTPLASNTNGTVDTPANPNSIATAGDVANAINNAGFIATSSANGGVNTGSKDHLVKTGEKLEFVAGKDMTITQEDGKFTFETNNQTIVNNTQLPVVYTKADGTKVYPQADGTFNTAPDGSGDKVDLGDVITSVQGADGSTTTPTTLTNVGSNLPATTHQTGNKGEISQVVPDFTGPNAGKLNNAATVSDVLNAGWNLQVSGTPADFINPYDTINFVGDKGVIVSHKGDGLKNTITISLDTGKIESDNQGAVSGTDGYLNAQDVANAINNSGFTITAQGENGSLVNPGESVDLKNNDGNIKVSKDTNSNDVSFDLADDVNIKNSITVGDVKIDKDNGIDAGNKQITNVASGGPIIEDGQNAANIGDLFELKTELESQMAPNKPITFEGNTGKTDQHLGSTLKVVGDNKNITTKAENNKISIHMSDTPTFDTVQVGGSNGPKMQAVKGPDGKPTGSIAFTNKDPNTGKDVLTTIKAADGQTLDDVATVRQLKQVGNNLNNALSNVKKHASAGAAAGIATANLPQPHDPGANMVSAAFGHYQGEQALAVGVSSISDNGRWILKGSLSSDTQHNVGAGVGVGYQW